MLAKRHRYLLPGVLPATNGGTAAEAKLCVGGGVAGGPRSDPASDVFLGWLVPSVNFQYTLVFSTKLMKILKI